MTEAKKACKACGECVLRTELETIKTALATVAHLGFDGRTIEKMREVSAKLEKLP